MTICYVPRVGPHDLLRPQGFGDIPSFTSISRAMREMPSTVTIILLAAVHNEIVRVDRTGVTISGISPATVLQGGIIAEESMKVSGLTVRGAGNPALRLAGAPHVDLQYVTMECSNVAIEISAQGTLTVAHATVRGASAVIMTGSDSVIDIQHSELSATGDAIRLTGARSTVRVAHATARAGSSLIQAIDVGATINVAHCMITTSLPVISVSGVESATVNLTHNHMISPRALNVPDTSRVKRIGNTYEDITGTYSDQVVARAGQIGTLSTNSLSADHAIIGRLIADVIISAPSP